MRIFEGGMTLDINILGIGAIIGATLVTGANLYIFNSNRKKDEIKERIDKLYSPLYAYYLEHMKYQTENKKLGLYEDYLALKKIYIHNSIYASDILKELFNDLFYHESELLNLSLEERAEKIHSLTFRNDKGIETDFKNMMYRIQGWIDREHHELQLYYIKGKIGRFLWRLEINNNPSYARGSLPAGRSFD